MNSPKESPKATEIDGEKGGGGVGEEERFWQVSYLPRIEEEPDEARV